MKAAETPTADAAVRAARCRICGKAASPGMPLCAQCRDAVKRARQVPTIMSQFMPLALSAPAGAVSGFVPKASPRGAPAAKRGRQGASATFVAIAAFGLAVCIGGFFVALEEDDAPAPPGIVPAVTTPYRLPFSRPQSPAPSAPEAAVAVGIDAAKPADVQPGRAAVAAKAHNRKAIATPAAPAGAAATAPIGPDGEATGTSADAAEANVAPVPVAAPPAPEPVVVDRWQAMNAAIAACGRENFFAGVICEQRVRLRYCDGYWGSVPQCGWRSPSENSR